MNRWERQYTWSPCTHCSVIKFKRDVETSAGVNANCKSLRFSRIKKQENRRLSSLFLPSNTRIGSSTVSTEKFPQSSYNLGDSVVEATAPGRKMRFVVTPCALDNENQ